MNLLTLVTPLIAMGGLLVLMQRVESRLTQKVRVEPRRAQAATRAQAMQVRGAAKSPLLAAAPMTMVLTVAVVVAGALVRMAS